MSAYVVSRDHIHFLVWAAGHLKRIGHELSWVWDVNRTGYGPGFTGSSTYQRRNFTGWDDVRGPEEMGPDALGQLLWDWNIRSVLYRYPDCTIDNMPGPVGENFTNYRYPCGTVSIVSLAWDEVQSPVDVLSACAQLEYQACEHPTWEIEEAYAALSSIRKRAIGALPGYDWNVPAIERIGHALEAAPKSVSVLSLVKR